MMAKAMGKTGAPIKAREMMYKAVLYIVLLYGSEIWVATDSMVMIIEEFYPRISIRIAEMMVRNVGRWTRNWRPHGFGQ